MRKTSRRSFTVEVKSTGRHHSLTIPSRNAAPVAPAPRLVWEPALEPSAPVAEKRRILPSLLAPESLQDEPEAAVPAQAPQRKRGRPPKPRSTAIEPVVEVTKISVPVPPAAPREERPTPIAQASRKTSPDLARGERWKRRLRGWSR